MARVLGAWRVINRSACCFFFCRFFIRIKTYNDLFLLQANRL
jgi:hypothetical protein